MNVYTFWNNKGGTGKTSLCFQSVVRYAENNPDCRVLVVDLCPQANLSELFMGGLLGSGATHLATLYTTNPRKSIGGYFDKRILSPYSMPTINTSDYIVMPYNYNSNIPQNISLIAGDSIVELQATFMSSAANGSLPNNQSPYALILKWLSDYFYLLQNSFDVVFIDTNPSFSIYTQVAIASTDKLILPVMADDSSRRALINALSLIYGYNTPSAYSTNSFNSVALANGIVLPKIHMVIKNRITQYMGPASGYRAVLQSIDTIVNNAKSNNPAFFTTNMTIQEVRDFQTTGVIAFAEAKSFTTLIREPLVHTLNGTQTTLNRSYIQQYIDVIGDVVANI